MFKKRASQLKMWRIYDSAFQCHVSLPFVVCVPVHVEQGQQQLQPVKYQRLETKE